MEQKNYTEVLIDGTIYTLGGTEEEAYLRKVASYLNEKIGKIKKQAGFSKQNADYQNLTVHLNIADDYFKEQERADLLAEQKAALEKDAYSLKHELITTQMKLEAVERELAAARNLLKDEMHAKDMQQAKDAQRAEDEKQKALQAAAVAAAESAVVNATAAATESAAAKATAAAAENAASATPAATTGSRSRRR